MKNITDILLDSAPVRTRLKFGVNTNVFVKSATNEVRRTKDNLISNRNCFIRFAKVDPETKKIIAETEVSFFNLDKREYAAAGFVGQYTQMITIMKSVLPSSIYSKVSKRYHKITQQNGEVFESITKYKQLAEKARKKQQTAEVPSELLAKMKVLLKRFADITVDVLNRFSTIEGPYSNLLLVVNKDGNFLGLPREEKGFITKEGAALPTVSLKYTEWNQSNKKKTEEKGDTVGDSLDESIDGINISGIEDEALDMGDDGDEIAL